jgi:hypothetical protein
MAVRAITLDVKPYDDLLPASQNALSSNALTIDVNTKIVDSLISNIPEDDNQWKVVA